MYKNMNDYEILYMVCDKEEDSFNLLMEKYRPLIYKVVKDYANFFKKFGYELDDLMQMGYITLYKASSKYDIYNHSMFYTYFKKSLMNMIISNIRLNTSSKREILNKALSYDTLIPKSDIPYIDLFPDKGNYYDISDDLIIFKNSMPAVYAYVFELYYNGYTKQEISVLLDEDIEDIRNYFQKIKKHALTYKSLFFI